MGVHAAMRDIGGQKMTEVEIVFYHVMHSVAPENFPKEKRLRIACSDTTTLKELLILANEPYADLSQYYRLSRNYCFNEQFVPYVLGTGEKIVWNIKYHDVGVEDFLRTHHIENNVIYAHTGIPQAGGPGIREIADLWTSYYPILDQVVTTLGAISAAVVAGKWIRSLFKPNASPPAIFDLILSRDHWNHIELADMAEIDKENSKMLLKAFGFIWDSSRKQYLKGPKSEEIMEKLSTVSVYCD